MDEANTPVPSPVVVVDNVSMAYRVVSSEQRVDTPKDLLGKALSRIRSRRPMVTVDALHPMSLIAHHGECVGVIGRNGSGKSTLLRLISGQESPSTGSVLATSTPIALGVSAALVPEMSGEANVMLGCLAMGLGRAEIEAKFDSIVELSALGKAIHLPMKSYSSGMASRLRFAIAAAVDPEILILDEALNTGDAEFGERTKARMTELREQAGCVFLVSHSMTSIRDLATRVIWLDKGELLHDGDTERVVTLYEKFIWYLRREDHASAEKIRRAARREINRVEITERAAGRRSWK